MLHVSSAGGLHPGGDDGRREKWADRREEEEEEEKAHGGQAIVREFPATARVAVPFGGERL